MKRVSTIISIILWTFLILSMVYFRGRKDGVQVERENIIRWDSIRYSDCTLIRKGYNSIIIQTYCTDTINDWVTVSRYNKYNVYDYKSIGRELLKSARERRERFNVIDYGAIPSERIPVKVNKPTKDE